MQNTLMMTLDYVGDEEAVTYAQVDQHPLARTTETSPERSSGTLSCLSARPPDLANPDGRTARGGVRAAEHCPREGSGRDGTVPLMLEGINAGYPALQPSQPRASTF